MHMAAPKRRGAALTGYELPGVGNVLFCVLFNTPSSFQPPTAIVP